MKILFVSNFFEPHTIGGYERLCAQVAQGLAERGHQIGVLTSDFGGDAPQPSLFGVTRELQLVANYEDIYAPCRYGEEERQAIADHNVAALRAVVSQLRPDLIFAWNLYFLDGSLLDEICALPIPSALFLTDNWLIAARNPDRVARFFADHVHGDQPFGADARFPAAEPIRSHAIFGSQFVRDLHAYAGCSFSAATVIHNGIVPPITGDTLPERDHLRRLGSADLLFAGRLVEIKGAHTAIEALASARRRLADECDLRLTIVGDARDVAYRDRLQNLVAELDLGDCVRFVPEVAEAALPALFNGHDLYLFPSLYEPFSLTLLLAMASGIPVIASRTGGNPEVVEDGRCGLLFRHGDAASLAEAIVRQIKAPGARAAMAKAGRRAALRYTLDRMLDRIELALQWTR